MGLYFCDTLNSQPNRRQLDTRVCLSRTVAVSVINHVAFGKPHWMFVNR